MPVCCLESLKKIESAINYTFKDRSLLLTALTHSSYSNEHSNEATENNERLEFLGDAVLGLVVSEFLYKTSEHLSEAEMAKYKAYLVSKTVLAETARKINVGDSLRLGKGEELSGGRDKDNILADAMEAIIGAVLLDSGYAEAQAVIMKILGQHIVHTLKQKSLHDYKTELQEWTQNIFGSLPEYKLISEKGKEHNKVFTVDVIVDGVVAGRGKGKSKKEAQMMAAKEALKNIKKTK